MLYQGSAITPVGHGVPVRKVRSMATLSPLDEVMDLLDSQGISVREVSLLLQPCRRVADLIPRSDLHHGPRISIRAEARELFKRVMPAKGLPVAGTVHERLNRCCGLPPDCTLLYDDRNGAFLKIVRIRKKGE